MLRGAGLHGGSVWVSGAKSSQYLSALLFMAPLIGEKVEIEVRDGLVSQPLVHTTIEVMRQAGIVVEAADDLLHFSIEGGQAYRAGEFSVNGDYPSSAALLAAGAVAGGDFYLNRLFVDSQGERAVLPLLREMGCDVDHDGESVHLWGDGGLRKCNLTAIGQRMQCSQWSQRRPAEGESRFYGIGNLRLKECDRISVPVRLLQRIGVDCEERGERNHCARQPRRV